MSVDPSEVQMRRNLPVLKGEDRLDQARNPSGGLEMADIGFHRSHGTGRLKRSPLFQDRT